MSLVAALVVVLRSRLLQVHQPAQPSSIFGEASVRPMTILRGRAVLDERGDLRYGPVHNSESSSHSRQCCTNPREAVQPML